MTYSLKDKLYILPYLTLWAITLVAIIKFNYGKYGSEILVGSVITFWLLMHFINLSMCLFISMGRPVYRKNERFIRQVVGSAQSSDGQWHSILTEDVSEGGIAFKITDGPVKDIAEGDTIKLTVKHQLFDIQLNGKVARISHRDNTAIYSVQVTVAPNKNRDHYLQLIYDGANKTLPSVQDTWVTPFDELYMNLVVRARTYERKLSRRFNRF